MYPTDYSNSADPFEFLQQSIIISSFGFVKITEIDYLTFVNALAEVGGIAVFVRVSILVFVKFLVHRNWENDVLASVTNWCDPPQTIQERN